jgi:hypothetical protein
MKPENTVVSLGQFRKQNVRAESRAQADRNAVTFGRTKAQKQLEAAETAKAKAALDAHHKDDGE